MTFSKLESERAVTGLITRGVPRDVSQLMLELARKTGFNPEKYDVVNFDADSQHQRQLSKIAWLAQFYSYQPEDPKEVVTFDFNGWGHGNVPNDGDFRDIIISRGFQIEVATGPATTYEPINLVELLDSMWGYKMKVENVNLTEGNPDFNLFIFTLERQLVTKIHSEIVDRLKIAPREPLAAVRWALTNSPYATTNSTTYPNTPLLQYGKMQQTSFPSYPSIRTIKQAQEAVATGRIAITV